MTVTTEKSVHIGGFALGAVVVCVGLILSLEIGAWSYNLVAGTLTAMMRNGPTRITDAELHGRLAQLRESLEPIRRAEAAARLAESRDRCAVGGLTAALRDSDSRVQRAAALALGDIGDPSAVPALTDLLKASGDLEIRRAAATAIGVIRHRR